MIRAALALLALGQLPPPGHWVFEQTRCNEVAEQVSFTLTVFDVEADGGMRMNRASANGAGSCAKGFPPAPDLSTTAAVHLEPEPWMCRPVDVALYPRDVRLSVPKGFTDGGTWCENRVMLEASPKSKRTVRVLQCELEPHELMYGTRDGGVEQVMRELPCAYGMAVRTTR